MALLIPFGHFLCITHATLYFLAFKRTWAFPAKVDQVWKLVHRGVPCAFVEVTLSIVALPTGTHLWIHLRFTWHVCDTCLLEWSNRYKYQVLDQVM